MRSGGLDFSNRCLSPARCHKSRRDRRERSHLLCENRMWRVIDSAGSYDRSKDGVFSNEDLNVAFTVGSR
jgi:hypothetical protein